MPKRTRAERRAERMNMKEWAASFTALFIRLILSGDKGKEWWPFKEPIPEGLRARLKQLFWANHRWMEKGEHVLKILHLVVAFGVVDKDVIVRHNTRFALAIVSAVTKLEQHMKHPPAKSPADLLERVSDYLHEASSMARAKVQAVRAEKTRGGE